MQLESSLQTNQIEQKIQGIRKIIGDMNYQQSIKQCTQIIDTDLQYLNQKQIKICVSLGIKSCILAKQHNIGIEQQAQTEQNIVDIEETIQQFLIQVKGICQVYGASINDLLIQQMRQIQDRSQSMFESIMNKVQLAQSSFKKSEKTSEDYRQIYQLLFATKSYQKIQKILVSPVSKNNLFKMAEINEVNFEYVEKYTQSINLYPQKCALGQKQINKTIKAHKDNIKKLILEQKIMLSNPLQENCNYLQYCELLEKIYVNTLKTMENSWQFIVQLKLALQQIRGFHQKLSGNYQSQNRKKLLQLRVKKGKIISKLIQRIWIQQKQYDQKERIRMTIVSQQPDQLNYMFELLQKFVKYSRMIVTCEIMVTIQTIRQLVPLVSFSLSQIFNFKSCQTAPFMEQFEQIESTIKVYRSQKIQNLSQVVNRCINLMSKLFNLQNFRTQKRKIQIKYYRMLIQKLSNEQQNKLQVLDEAALSILCFWLSKPAFICNNIKKIQEKVIIVKDKSLQWLNIFQKLSHISANAHMAIQQQQSQALQPQSTLLAIKNLQQCNQYIQQQTDHSILSIKYKNYLNYLKLRKQKHYRKVYRQIDFKRYVYHQDDQKNKLVNSNQDHYIQQFWLKQKNTKIAQNLLMIALLKINIGKNMGMIKRKEIQKQSDLIVKKAVKIWSIYRQYNLNSFSRVKLIRYWLQRNFSNQAYQELKKLKHYKSQDVTFYSGDCYSLNEKNHQNDVKFYQNLVKSVHHFADQNVDQKQISQYFQTVLQQTMQPITHDTLMIFKQIRLLKNISIKIDKQAVLRKKIIMVSQNMLNKNNIKYDSLFYSVNQNKYFAAYNYNQLYKSNKVIVYESNFHNKQLAAKARKIVQNLWPISHQNICTVQLIEDIQQTQYDFRVYVSLYDKSMGESEVDFRKFIKNLLKAIFYLGRYIPNQLKVSAQALHFLSSSQFQINPIQCFQINKSQCSKSKLLKNQKQLLKKAYRSLMKHLRILNKNANLEQKYSIEDYLINLFDQYLQHMTKNKILFHQDPQASFYHPFFWKQMEISKFIDQFQAQMQYLTIQHSDNFRKKLDDAGKNLIHNDWGVGLDPQIVRDILHKESLKAQGRYKHFIWDNQNFKGISYLVNCIRNSIHHYIQNQGFDRFSSVQEIVLYFLRKYPKLLSFLWQNYDSLHKKFKQKFSVK